MQEEPIHKLQQIFQKFFLAVPLKIGDAKLLALHLAERGKILKESLDEMFKDKVDMSDFSKKIQQLYDQ